MKRQTVHRVFAIVLAMLLTCLFGCMKNTKSAQATPTPQQVQIVEFDSLSDPGSDAAEHTGIYCVDETTAEENSGAYASVESDENAVLVENGGTLSMTKADVNKLGDATEAVSSGQNAAIAATTGGQCTLSECIVTSNAVGGIGLYASGFSTLLTATDCYLVTSSSSSAGLCATDGAAISFSGGNVSTEGTDSPCLLLSGNASLSLSGASLSSSGSDLLSVVSGDCSLTASAQTLTGTVSIANGATLSLSLTNGSAFSGSFRDSLPARANVLLDASSSWSLTEDVYVSVFSNADTTQQNIASNGFSIYYDSEAAGNAALNSQSFLLPGGGFLAPVI